MRKTNLLFAIFVYISYLIFFAIFFLLAPLILSFPLYDGGFKTISSKNDSYRVRDNFYDSEEFYTYRSKESNVNIMANFFNKISNAESFEVVSSFNQAIVVKEFKGDDKFYYNSEAFLKENISEDANVKALQLNENAFHQYGIKVGTGDSIIWESVDYNTCIPVLLGDSYKDYYHIGDFIFAKYYNRNVELEVVGFIEKGCKINYRSLGEVNLDTYLIVPYPEYLWEVDGEFQFESILYFAMINCDLMAKSNEEVVLSEIKNIANSTGFTNFSVIGLDWFQLNNIEAIRFMEKYRGSVIVSLITLYLIVIIAVTIFFSKRNNLLEGINIANYKYNKLFTVYLIVPGMLAFICGFFVSYFIYGKIFMMSIVIGVLGLVISYIFVPLLIHKRNFKESR